MEIPWHETDPACVRAATETATLLSELGHTVVPVDPPRYDMAGHDWRYGMSGPAPTMVARDLDVVADIIGRPLIPADVGPVLWWMTEQGRSFTALQALEFAEFVHRTCVIVDRWWEEENLDLLLTPTLAQRTPPITEYLPPPAGTYVVSLDDPASIGLAMLALFPLVGFTQLFNWTGQPAASLPLCVDEDGLPVGIQLAGRRLREDHLLDVAAELETARPWAGRVPPCMRPPHWARPPGPDSDGSRCQAVTLVSASSRMARLSVDRGVGGGQRWGDAEPAADARQCTMFNVQAELGAASGDGSAELVDVRAAVDPLEPAEQSPATDVADHRVPLGELVPPAAQPVINLWPPCSDASPTSTTVSSSSICSSAP